MTDIWVMKAVYERNATDGISHHTSLESLASAVHDAEKSGANVQVYKCVPMDHLVYTSRVSIELYTQPESPNIVETPRKHVNTKG